MKSQTGRSRRVIFDFLADRSYAQGPIFLIFGLILTLWPSSLMLKAQGVEGYYRYPTLHEETIVFCAEGDLWTVPVSGGLARRLTSHPGEETHPKISPDGKTLAFTAAYEGPSELYTMPIEGGLPRRWTYESESSMSTGWTPQGELVYTTTHYSTLPNSQLVAIDTVSRAVRRLPLSQASEASFDASGKTTFFVRPPDHRNVTKRYSGGTARQIWRFTEGAAEAERLTTDHKGESHHPMWWESRVYFVTDRDGSMNLWSMAEDGSGLRQHTDHEDFDVRQPSLSDGKVVYHWAGDIWIHDILSGDDQIVPIRIVSDLDQLREKWVTKPSEYITHVGLHPEGSHVVFTARGRVFVAPVKGGRLVSLSRKPGVRYRDAVFSADGNEVLALSDESSEFEFVRLPVTGIGDSSALTRDGEILRYQGYPSPDGKWLVYGDHNEDLWLLELESGLQRKISTNNNGIRGASWAPDSQWVAFVQDADNTFSQILLHQVSDGTRVTLTSDRANSRYPVWHPGGKWIYFLSDRNFQTLVGSPWGARQPEPYFDRKMKVYQVSLQKGLRSPFRPNDELHARSEDEAKKKKPSEALDGEEGGSIENDESVSTVSIDTEGIQSRIQEVSISPGNYASLQGNEKALFFIQRETGLNAKSHLKGLKIGNDDSKVVTLVEDVRGFEVCADGEKMLIRKGGDYHVVDASVSAVSKLGEKKVDLSGWGFSINVREDWRQIFTDAWRMERDYFYDPGMHNVGWDAVYQKYLPLVERITSRDELSDLIGRLVGELSALHTSVRGGDLRKGEDQIRVASLGARFERDAEAGGYRIEHIYQADPDYPNERSPLDHPELDLNVGDVVIHIDGVPTLSVTGMGELLRNKTGKQVRLSILTASGVSRDEMVIPIGNESRLRYDDWEYSRRQIVEEQGTGRLGYVHLQAMGSSDLEQWYREFYPVFDRQGLIIDVRHNRGGNIESFILEKLLRKDWMYWKSRGHRPEWNMQYAFRGHLVVLCDELTASDGEAFADGFRRLGLGKVIGTRTWGGEIWLSSNNRLTDNGLARAPSAGVYGPEGEWLIEQIGVVPDIEVDNLPHATFNGQDAQLDSAIAYLLEEIEKDPREVPAPPSFPDRSIRNREPDFRR
ncbi:S41 family peptidase [Verrucomicrobia bacterium]|nr:S41 family peptidase [Verrucomicrobiota bacterium]MDB4797957.1 S41 family peptidase [Verrucomicrobiota bacterium]